MHHIWQYVVVFVCAEFMFIRKWTSILNRIQPVEE